MMAPTHRLGGIAAGAGIAAILHTDTTDSAIMIAAALLGCLLPDIDNSHSSISRKWSFVSMLVSAGQGIIRLFSNIFKTKTRTYIRSLIGHRGLTHSLFPVLLLPGIMFIVSAGVGSRYGIVTSIGLAAGMISHLLLDMLSGGVPLFMPFTTKRVCIARIKTGSLLEWLFGFAFLFILISFGWEVISKWLK